MSEVEPIAVVGVPGATPVPVVVAGPIPTAGPPVQQQQHDPSVPATTTFQEDLVTAGQRRINLVWEHTQQIIAIAVTFTTLAVCAMQIWRGDGAQGAFLLLSNVFFLVIGTYFQRTNHTQIGGTGPKANEQYKGR